MRKLLSGFAVTGALLSAPAMAQDRHTSYFSEFYSLAGSAIITMDARTH